VVLGAAASAHAQSTRRPDLNMFGRGLREPEQSLGIRGNLGVTFYDRLTTIEPAGDGPTIPDHGWGTFGSAALTYNLRLASLTFDGTIGTFASYYPNQAQRFRSKALPGAGMRTNWNRALSDNTQLNLGFDLRFRPAYAESIFPSAGFGDGFATGSDPNTAFLPQEAAFVDGTYLTVRPSISMRHTLSRRWAVSVGYEYERNRGFGLEPGRGFLSAWRYNATGALHFAATRNLSVRGGYRYEKSRFDGTPKPYTVQGFDFGVDYGRGLQLTRRTTLTLGGGATGYADRAGNRHYRLTGDVALAHEFQRTWATGVRYSRGIDSNQVIFREPLLTDTFIGFVDGLFTRRLGGHASATVQGGSLAAGGPETGTIRNAARAGLQTSLGRHFAVSVDYTYVSAITRPSGLPARSASQGVYAYVSTWAPIFQRGGRSNVAR
jgi:hypothetical protein